MALNLPKVQCRISAFLLTMILTTSGIFVTSACVATITTVFSEHAAITMAHQLVNVMMEKTTLRVKGALDHAMGIVTASQTGVVLPSGTPMPFEDNPDTWDQKWRRWGTMFQKSFDTPTQNIAYIFDDGSYVSVAPYMLNLNGTRGLYIACSASLGQNTPLAKTSGPAPISIAKSIYYNYTTMKYVGEGTNQVQTEPRLRVGYNRSLPIFSSTYSSLMAIGGLSGRYPTLMISYSLFNASQVFLGIGEIQLNLNTFESLVQAQRPTPNTHIVIMGRDRTIVASSVHRPILSNVTVPLDYNLTVIDAINGCALSATDAPFGFLFLVCLRNAQNFGYEPLKVMDDEGLIPSKDAKTISQGVSREDLGHLGHHYVAIVDYNKHFANLDWIGVVIVPENEILNDIMNGRNVAISVSVALAIAIALGNGLLLRLLLRPLAEVVSRMRSAAYLKEESLPDQAQSASGDGEMSHASLATSNPDQHRRHKKLRKAAQAAKQLNDNRTLSYLIDVAAIQTAYWNMADEIGTLRGYIPEYLRDRLLASRSSCLKKEAPATSTTNDVAKDSNEVSLSSIPEIIIHNSLETSDNKRLNLAREASSAVTIEQLNEWVAASSVANITCSNELHLSERLRSSNTSQRYIDDEESPSPQDDSASKQTDIQDCRSKNAFTSPLSHSFSSFPNLLEIIPPLEDAGSEQPPTPRSVQGLPSEKASTRQAARFASLGDRSVTDARLIISKPLPVFSENGLSKRNIGIAAINITEFHQFVLNNPASKVVKDHELFVAYIHEVAKRYGGVLDTFNGDKFWVSFNASTLCEDFQLAAIYFANEVATKINKDALNYQQYLASEKQRSPNMPPLAPQRPRFLVAQQGITIGVATGWALVGPLGTKNIRRHTVTSNAISEAAALERLAARYPDCGVLVGGDIIPAIENFFQYLILDASVLPGSGNFRRRVASIKGPIVSSYTQSRVPNLLDLVLQKVNCPLPATNPYEDINDCFNAFLEGRISDVIQKLGEISLQVELSKQAHQQQKLNGMLSLHMMPLDRPLLSPSEYTNISIMIQFITSVGDGIDGRLYRSPLGDLFDHAL